MVIGEESQHLAPQVMQREQIATFEQLAHQVTSPDLDLVHEGKHVWAWPGHGEGQQVAEAIGKRGVRDKYDRSLLMASIGNSFRMFSATGETYHGKL
jgi:hypothetical protein